MLKNMKLLIGAFFICLISLGWLIGDMFYTKAGMLIYIILTALTVLISVIFHITSKRA